MEHPVTEMITQVNLPAAQLQVAMGIPLDNIPEIRTLYGRNRFETFPKSINSRIDFTTAVRQPSNGHCIAVRITAENAEAGFKPTSGGIQELNFRSTPNVWGYFSMDSSGSIHEFADSQFGHLFANGIDREQARRNMVLALKELSIRGDISTTVDYISRLIELQDFIDNNIDTAWLDGIIKQNVEGIGSAIVEAATSSKPSAASASASTSSTSTSDTDIKKSLMKRNSLSVSDLTQEDSHLFIVLGATISAYENCDEDEKQFLELLAKGQLPPRTLLKMSHKLELILNGIKYKLRCTRKGLSSFKIELANNNNNDSKHNDITNGFVMSNVRPLSDGGYLIEIGGQSHVAYLTNKGDAGTGMRLNVAGSNIVFSPDYDPTSLRTDVAGKLVKRLVSDGTRVKKGEPYAEIEVMKMFMPLKVEESGVVEWKINEGAALSPGDLCATLTLDNPENVTKTTIFNGNLHVQGWGGSVRSSSTGGASATTTTGLNYTKRPLLILRNAVDELHSCMSGYSVLEKNEVDNVIDHDISIAVTDSSLPMLEIDEQLSILSGRVPAPLFTNITQLIAQHQHDVDGGKKQIRYVKIFFFFPFILLLVVCCLFGIFGLVWCVSS